MAIVGRRKARSSALKGRSAWLSGLVWQRLGQIDYTAGGGFYDESTGYTYTPGSSNASSGSSYSGAGISPTDAALLSTAITTAGKVGTQAIIGTPTVTYNPLTGTYMATGGAAIPAGLTTSTAITEYLPYLLLFGGIFLVISMGRR